MFRDKIAAVHPIEITADELVYALLRLSRSEPVSLLDSCGVGHLGSHLLIAGLEPQETFEVSHDLPQDTLALLDKYLSGSIAAIFTLSYEFGTKLQLGAVVMEQSQEPDLFLSTFDTLIFFDYDTGRAWLAGNKKRFEAITQRLSASAGPLVADRKTHLSSVSSNFSKHQYISAIYEIHELIRSGDTYQTNLTQQLTADLPPGLTREMIFARLRRDHPAPFASFITRRDSAVVSISPERFFRVDDGGIITTSPIKGTRPRGATPAEDDILRVDLLKSAKDRAENTMIVDLLRNDLGRVCDYGSVKVDKLCDLEEHPTLFHLVSTISGRLRPQTSISDIITALYPCGSITGAPKISTMKIIEGLESGPRGLSMGSIGYYLPRTVFGTGQTLDLNVAIRTMVIRDRTATFNVGGGIVIDSEPEMEYDESLIKARALLSAIGVTLPV